MAIFSIVVPYYHTYKWNLDKLLCSFASQAIPKKYLEVIFIGEWDDDEPKDIFQKYEDKLDIKWFQKGHDVQHTSPGISRQIGIDNCTGDWITFVDADDYLRYGYFQYALKLINKNKNAKFTIIYNDKVFVTLHGTLFNVEWIKNNNIQFYKIDFTRYEDTFFMNKCIACANYNNECFVVEQHKQYYIYQNNWKSILHTITPEIQRIMYIALKSHMQPFLEWKCDKNREIVLKKIVLYYYYYYCYMFNRLNHKQIYRNKQLQLIDKLYRKNLREALSVYGITKHEMIQFFEQYDASLDIEYIEMICSGEKIENDFILFEQFVDKFC